MKVEYFYTKSSNRSMVVTMGFHRQLSASSSIIHSCMSHKTHLFPMFGFSHCRDRNDIT